MIDALRLVYVVGADQARDWRRLDPVLDGGATALWLREPEASGAELYRIGRDLVTRCRARGAALIVGDRTDVALALGADGVQLGHRSPPAHRVRPWYSGWLGVSCHSEGDLKHAEEAKADYAVLSPVYGVPSKGSPLGPALFGKWRAAVRIPVLGLGGVDTGNAGEVRRAGADGVAVIRALREAADPLGAAKALRAAMTGA